MTLAVITLSREGAILAHFLAKNLPGLRCFVHESVEGPWEAELFSSIIDLTACIFNQFTGLVYVAPCGVVVRAVADHLKHKTSDPAVVVVDVRGRWAVSLLSGHEGGANELALRVANILSAEPVVTTTTEALKDLIVGIGCRRGSSADNIVSAIQQTLRDAHLDQNRVRLLSSAQLKSDEAGLLEASRQLGIPLRFILHEEIRNTVFEFEHSQFVNNQVELPAVAEPCALLAGRRTTFVVRKRIFDGVTVAVARENCSW